MTCLYSQQPGSVKGTWKFYYDPTSVWQISLLYFMLGRYKIAYKKRHVRAHNIKSHSALLQDFIARKNSSSALPIEKGPISITKEATNKGAVHQNGHGQMTRGRLHGSRLASPEYLKLTNSASTDSQLCKRNGTVNGHSVGNSAANEHSLGYVNTVTLEADISKPLSDDIVIDYTASTSDNKFVISSIGNGIVQSSEHEVAETENAGIKCDSNLNVIDGECIDCVPFTEYGGAVDLDLIPPPYKFISSEPPNSTKTINRKITTTV